MALSDLDLKRWQQGEMAGLEALYGEFGTAVYRLCRNVLGHGADAEDATQEVFLRLHEKRKTFQGKSSLATWIYRLATNHCINLLRRTSRRPTPLPDEDLPLTASPERSPLQHASLQDDVRAAQGLLQRLPADLRTILVLRESEQLKYRQIAEVLEIPMGTVMSRLDRARQQLQRLMGVDPIAKQPRPTPTSS